MARERQRYTIHEVVTLLQGEFPLTASNLRYWEKQGLLQPGRTEGGHRLFDDEDLARIRLIKRLQSKRAFSLETLRRYLQSGLSVAEIARHLEQNEWLYRPLGYEQSFVPLDLPALLEATGLSAAELSALEEGELIAPINEGDSVPVYDEDGVAMAKLAGKFMRAGLTASDFAPLNDQAAQLARTHLETFVTKLFGEGAKTSSRALLPEAEDFVRLLYHRQLLRVAQQLAKEGFFWRFQHEPPNSPAPTQPSEESK
jgi:hypothetical protein